MILTVVLFCLCQVLCTISFCIFLRHVINAKQAEIERRAEAAMRDWLTAPEGEPSKAAMLIDKAGQVIGSAAARSIMASLQVEKSHVARVANGISDEIKGAQNPILGLLAGGKRGKGAAVMQLAGLLQGILSPGGKGLPSSGNGHSDITERIRNQK